jgi:hypothetical protein
LAGADARDARYETARVEMAKLFKRDYDSSVFLHRLVGDAVAKSMVCLFDRPLSERLLKS